MPTAPRKHGGTRSAPVHAHVPRRDSARARGYTNKWEKARAAFLRVHPLCVACEREDHQLTSATVVDHVIPHKGDTVLFWDSSNWQALCKRHHDRKTATEDGGFGRPRA
ncbi:MAG: HNH endonuclease [Gammaproteobacteria bacterium]